MRAVVVVVVVSLLGGCATVEAPRIVGNEPAVVWEQAPDQSGAPRKHAPMSTDEARSIALAHDAAHNCEITARMLREKDKQRGWAVMKECVLRPDFTDLETLLSPPWVYDLKEQPDYGNLVGHVIAVRGGDVQNDLRLVTFDTGLPIQAVRGAMPRHVVTL